MMNKDIKLIALLINEDIDDSDEYEDLEDTDEFEENVGWGGGFKSGEWELEEWQLTIEGIGIVWLSGRLTYEIDFHKGYPGSHHSPPEPAYIEIYDPEVAYFELYSAQFNYIALWRAGTGLNPNSIIKLTNEQIQQVKDFMIEIWEQQEEEIIQHEGEVYQEPEE